MAGVVLETLSWRKLLILGAFLLVVVILSFIIGGVIAVSRTTYLLTMATFCVDEKGSGNADWFIPRGSENCTRLNSLDSEEEYNGGLSTHQIVFAFLLPSKRDGRQLQFSRWQRSMVSWLELDILDSKDVPLVKDALITLEARIGYKNKGDNSSYWRELASSHEERTPHCQEQYQLNDIEEDAMNVCEVSAFFELASLHHDYYLVNFRVPVRSYEDINMKIGKLRNITLGTTFEAVGFTKIWVYLKTMLFPLMLMAVVWYWRRVRKLARSSTLLERTIFTLGITISLLNCPIEWLTLVVDIPAMTLINNFRQTILFGILMSFGIIFVGEHLCEWSDGNFLTDYWKRLFAIFTGCFFFLLFKVCERGVTMANPFDSIWMTSTGLKISLAILIALGAAAMLCFLYLCYLNVSLFRHASTNNRNKRTYCMGLKCVLVTTVLCVAMTLANMVMTELWEAQRRRTYTNLNLDYTATFWFGVYGMWNAYVLGILSLFAPSNKPQRQGEEGSYGLVADTTDGEVQA